MGLLAVAGVTTAYDADAARHCTNGFVKYEGRCVPLGLKRVEIKRKNAQPVQTGSSAPFKTCPFYGPMGPIQVPC